MCDSCDTSAAIMNGIQDRFTTVMKSFAKKEKKEQSVPDTEVVDDAPKKDNYFKRVKVSRCGPVQVRR